MTALLSRIRAALSATVMAGLSISVVSSCGKAGEKDVPAAGAPVRYSTVMPDTVPSGTVYFLTGGTYGTDAFSTLVRSLADAGWEVILPQTESPRVFTPFFADRFTPDSCEVVIGFGPDAAEAFRVTARHADNGADGLVTIAGLVDDEKPAHRTRTASAAITAEFDPVATPETVRERGKAFPSGSQFLTIRGGNRAGFLDDITIPGDGRASITAPVQKEVTGKIIINLLESWCREYMPQHGQQPGDGQDTLPEQP